VDQPPTLPCARWGGGGSRGCPGGEHPRGYWSRTSSCPPRQHHVYLPAGCTGSTLNPPLKDRSGGRPEAKKKEEKKGFGVCLKTQKSHWYHSPPISVHPTYMAPRPKNFCGPFVFCVAHHICPHPQYKWPLWGSGGPKVRPYTLTPLKDRSGGRQEGIFLRVIFSKGCWPF